MHRLTDAALFQKQYPTLQSIESAFESRLDYWSRYTDNDRQLVAAAIKHYGSLANMPTGYWHSDEQTMYLYNRVIKYVEDTDGFVA